MTSRYSIIPVVLEPICNPGDTCKIGIFLSGYGNPKKNKLFISYNPKLTSQEKPGEVIDCIKTITDKKTGKTYVATGGKQTELMKLGKEGAITGGLPNAFFSNMPNITFPSHMFPQICSEVKWDNLYPIEVNLNIFKKCHPGDYDLDFVFTYGDENNILQDKNRVSIHITSWLERHMLETTISLALASIIVGFLALKGIFF